jgi:ferredoxin
MNPDVAQVEVRTPVDDAAPETPAKATEPVVELEQAAAEPSARPACLVKPDLRFKKDLAQFGGETFSKCYQCATCSVVCTLAPDEAPFPRKEMIWTNWGLKDRLIRDPDIWACYYCGKCSERCPRGADPGELMMALRRYAISRYDWTGLSRRFYTSRAWEIGAIVIVALIVVGLFALSGAFAPDRMPTDRVSVGTFINVEWVHWGDWIMAGVLTFFLLTNSLRMCRFILNGRKIPLSAYITELKTFFIHFTTQKKWRECGENTSRWLKHLLLVIGYSTMFLLVMFFLPALQIDSSNFTWVSILGYYATAVILFFSADALLSRMRKRDEMHKFSHDSDWVFLILLFLTGLTGIVMHTCRILGLPLPTYFMYVIHLAVAVPMLVVEVPFMKWAHLMYRPLALYLKAVIEKADRLEAA